MPTLRVHEEDRGFLVGQIGNLGVIIWRETATVARVERTIHYFSRFENDPGQGFGLMALVTEESAPPSSDVRQALDRGMRDARDSILGIAVVIESTGLLGGLARAVARTMSVISRTPYPLSTFATVEDAASWLPHVLAQRGAEYIETEHIVSAVEANRSM